jgi:hypothetical protein
VTGFAVFYELVLAIVAHTASTALVGFLVGVSALMIVAVANGGEALSAVLAFVRLFSSVNAHVHKQITALIKRLQTVSKITSVVVVTKTTHV